MPNEQTRPKLTSVSLIAGVIPLAFLIGFIIAAVYTTDASLLVLLAVAIMAAAVPVVPMIVWVSGTRRR